MELLYALLVLLAVTRLAGEGAVRLKQPALVGEIVAGILVGTAVHAFPETFPTLGALADDPEFSAVTDLGVFFLMLLAGLEMHPRELARGSVRSVAVAVGGALLPGAMGFGLGWFYLPQSEHHFAQACFLGTAVAVTAVPVAIKVLMDLDQLDSPVGRTVVAAAIIDDILSLVMLAILTAIIRTGQLPDAGSLIVVIAKITVFFVATTLVGKYVLPKLGPRINKLMGSEVEFSLLVLVALAYAVLAEMLGMHFIIGAFVAGLGFGSRTLPSKTYEYVEGQISGLTKGLLAPIFFASIGLHFDLQALVSVPGFVAALVFVAIIGKLIGTAAPALLFGMRPRNSLAVGVAMSARGAVELIIAGIAMRAGLFSVPSPRPPIIEHMFSAVVVMALFTTLITPIALRHVLPRN